MLKLKTEAFDYEGMALDPGNEQLKGARVIYIEGQARMLRALTRNAVYEITKDEYQKVVSQHGIGSNKEYISISAGRSGTKYFVVGDAALRYMSNWETERRALRSKYVPTYLGPIFVYMVGQLFGESIPDDMIVVTARPPSLNLPEINTAIYSILRRKWKIEICGMPATFNVAEVLVKDEIVGGGLNLSLQADGSINGNGLFHGSNETETFIVDLGGGTLDVALMSADGVAIPGTAKSAEIGVSDAIRDFRQLLNSNFVKRVQGLSDYKDENRRPLYDSVISLFQSSRSGVPNQTVYEVILSDTHVLEWNGLEIDCSDLFQEAMMGIIARVGGIVTELAPSSNLLSVKRIAITGGAGTLLYPELAESVFLPFSESHNLHLCTNKWREGIYANVFGLAKQLEFYRKAIKNGYITA